MTGRRERREKSREQCMATGVNGYGFYQPKGSEYQETETGSTNLAEVDRDSRELLAQWHEM